MLVWADLPLGRKSLEHEANAAVCITASDWDLIQSFLRKVGTRAGDGVVGLGPASTAALGLDRMKTINSSTERPPLPSVSKMSKNSLTFRLVRSQKLHPRSTRISVISSAKGRTFSLLSRSRTLRLAKMRFQSSSVAHPAFLNPTYKFRWTMAILRSFLACSAATSTTFPLLMYPNISSMVTVPLQSSSRYRKNIPTSLSLRLVWGTRKTFRTAW
mmetsp:Transcript_50502/g.114711  ORF Transcript_50502/g.114711 Transcript_50502/m.114711 type:complete len:215 (+) Transcript_50502:363-1007(+)